MDAYELLHKRLTKLEELAARTKTAPTIPKYEIATDGGPQDPIEGQIAIGNDDNALWHFVNGIWRKNDTITLAAATYPATIQVFSTLTTASGGTPSTPIHFSQSYPDQFGIAMIAGGEDDFDISATYENDYYKVDWINQPTAPFQLKQTGIYSYKAQVLISGTPGAGDVVPNTFDIQLNPFGITPVGSFLQLDQAERGITFDQTTGMGGYPWFVEYSSTVIVEHSFSSPVTYWAPGVAHTAGTVAFGNITYYTTIVRLGDI